MTDIEEEAVDNLRLALDRFDEALAIPLTNPLALDGTIQRFEFCFELSWKAAKVVGKHFGSDKRSPREAIKAAFGFSWIDDEEFWLQMMNDRNISSHTYREDIARELYAKLPLYARIMRKLAVSLQKALAESTL